MSKTREAVDKQHIDQANTLEAEFYKVVNKGKPSQHRVLREGKTIEEFNQRHGQIWKGHEAELLAEGIIQPSPAPEPRRDLKAEIDDLKARLASLEAKGQAIT